MPSIKKILKIFLFLVIFLLSFLLSFLFLTKTVGQLDEGREMNVLDKVRQLAGETVKPDDLVAALKKLRDQVTVTVLIDAPFAVQAPFGDWQDQRFQDGCEEAVVLMAVKWARGEKLTKETAQEEILKMAAYEQEKYGSFADTAAADTAERLIKGYFSYKNFRVDYQVDKEAIIKELTAGNLVLVPTNGQRLGNPYYTAPGPERHMLVLRGYDPASDQFITNDPGTKRGQGYRYGSQVLLKAIVNYPTGDHEPLVKEERAMIVVTK